MTDSQGNDPHVVRLILTSVNIVSADYEFMQSYNTVMCRQYDQHFFNSSQRKFLEEN